MAPVAFVFAAAGTLNLSEENARWLAVELDLEPPSSDVTHPEGSLAALIRLAVDGGGPAATLERGETEQLVRVLSRDDRLDLAPNRVELDTLRRAAEGELDAE